MKPVKLSQDVVNLLNERINDEYSHYYFYKQAANYCEEVGYLKAAEFFNNETKEEISHAEGIQKYLTDWNIKPTLMAIEAPVRVSGLVDAIEKSYQKEYELYESYEKTSKEVFEKGDICTFDFLQQYRGFQRAAVADYATFLNQLDLFDKNDMNWVFQFEKKMFK